MIDDYDYDYDGLYGKAPTEMVSFFQTEGV